MHTLRWCAKWLFGSIAAIVVVSCSLQVSAAPADWTLKGLDGGRYTLSENLNHGPVLILFWATWCRPCKQEMREYKSVFESYQEKNIQVLAISEDNSRTQSKVGPYIKGAGYNFTVLLDPAGEVLKSYGGISIPYTVVLDSAGEVQKVYRGKIRRIGGLSALLDRLLEQSPSE